MSQAADLKRIGDRIRYERKYHYASLPAAAKAAGLPKSTWSKIENGKCNFTYSTLMKVCGAIFCDPSDIL